MTIELFIYLFTIGSTISSLVTQATKKTVPDVPSNIVALINAILVGLLGTIITFVFCGIPFDAKNLISAVLMGVCIFIGSTVGYDKVLQTIRQIKG